MIKLLTKPKGRRYTKVLVILPSAGRKGSEIKEESKSVKLRGWDAMVAAGGVISSYVATALLMAWPLAWLANHAFGPGVIRLLFGRDSLSYWQCVMVFAIWYCTRVRLTFPFTVAGKF